MTQEELDQIEAMVNEWVHDFAPYDLPSDLYEKIIPLLIAEIRRLNGWEVTNGNRP